MALEIIKNIDVDFYNKEYILVNAKQYDTNSRVVSITCYNQGEFMRLSDSQHSAYVRYRKADGHPVLNSCRINSRSQVLVELTEQMLAANGICYVDLIIINKGSAIFNTDTGEILTIDDSSILSTMAFYVNAYEAVMSNSEVESSYEYEGLNDLMQRAEADYREAIQLTKSYAVGNAGGIRDNEDIDNAKYYYEQSLINANDAKASQSSVATSESNAKISEANARASETNAATSESNASASEKNAYDYSVVSQRYAVGGTNTVSGEDADNAKYYYGQIKGIYDGLDGSLSPKGTIAFEELATAEKFTGALYVMGDSFVTDETFVEGEDVSYPAGTLVYYTVDGLWATFEGVKSDIATVDEVKSYLGI